MPHSLLISDLHLSSAQPSSTAAFLRFIDGHAVKANALYILGDLFEYWAGDDDIDDPCHAQVIDALASLSRHGTRVFLMRGNRDLLIGNAFAASCNGSLLEDPALVDLYGTPTLLSHGDMLCTDDVDYQHYREQMHDAKFQKEFLAKPLAERKAFIERLRERSIEAKQHKGCAIMDVTADAVTALLREYRYPRLVHGHTHRPGRHEHEVDGHTCERWVLGDWDRHGSALRVDAKGCSVITISSAP